MSIQRVQMTTNSLKNLHKGLSKSLKSPSKLSDVKLSSTTFNELMGKETFSTVKAKSNDNFVKKVLIDNHASPEWCW